jgi:hypothetical protein
MQTVIQKKNIPPHTSNSAQIFFGKMRAKCRGNSLEIVDVGSEMWDGKRYGERIRTIERCGLMGRLVPLWMLDGADLWRVGAVGKNSFDKLTVGIILSILTHKDKGGVRERDKERVRKSELTHKVFCFI